MKAKRVIEVITYSYPEQQYILNRFPESYWVYDEDKSITRFYIANVNEDVIYKAVLNWHQKNQKG